jgi:protein SCO1/2
MKVLREIRVQCRQSKGSAKKSFALFALALGLLALPSVTNAQFPDPTQGIGVRPELLKDVSVDQKLNESIPLGLTFKDEHGQTVQLSKYFVAGKPVILSLVYYSCPMLCTQVLNGMDRSLKQIPLTIGKDFNVLTISIDPTEKPVLAEAKQALYTGMYGRPGAADGWHFLVGEDSQINQLASAVGFHYAYDPDSHQYAHASVIMVLTPEGRISRYFYGISYPDRDLRLGLVDASDGKIGSPVDAILLYCYHYDPHTGKYGLLINRIIIAAGLLTVALMSISIFILARGEHYALPTRRA